MKHFSWVLGACVAWALVGCSGNPLDGHWATTSANSITVVGLNGDGSVTITVTFTGNCSGTLNYTGNTWTSSASIITFGGQSQCTGNITCGGTTLSGACGMGPQTTGACNYTLSMNNNVLTTSGCTSASNDQTLTRM